MVHGCLFIFRQNHTVHGLLCIPFIVHSHSINVIHTIPAISFNYKLEYCLKITSCFISVPFGELIQLVNIQPYSYHQ